MQFPRVRFLDRVEQLNRPWTFHHIALVCRKGSEEPGETQTKQRTAVKLSIEYSEESMIKLDFSRVFRSLGRTFNHMGNN